MGIVIFYIDVYKYQNGYKEITERLQRDYTENHREPQRDYTKNHRENTDVTLRFKWLISAIYFQPVSYQLID